MSQPYLSFILASRNDDHAGGMLPRLQVCVDNLVEQVERHELPSELVVVDWNPPPERALLRDALSWPSATEFCTVRVIEVPPSVHQGLRFSDKLPFLVHTAWNAGVRRARGEFVLSLTNDLLLSDEVVQFLATQTLNPESIYRIDRYDIPERTLELPTLADRLAFAKRNVRRVHGLDGALRLPDFSIKLHTNAAGDFVLLSKEYWATLRGLPQESEYHSFKFDGIMMFMAHAAGVKQVLLQDPMRVYHVSHGVSDWMAQDRWPIRAARRFKFLRSLAPGLGSLARRLLPPKSQVSHRGAPQMTKAQYRQSAAEILEGKRSYVYNDENWGLGNLDLPDTVAVAPSRASRY